MKLQPRKIDKNDKIKYLDVLYTAVSSLSSKEEIKNFLKDLLTESERIMLGRRILIAQKLLEGQSYQQIMDEMKVGPDTIMRVHRWLEDDRGGYEKAIKELEKTFKSRITRRHDHFPATSFGQLKKKYPMHFFLFNLFDDLNKK